MHTAPHQLADSDSPPANESVGTHKSLRWELEHV